MPIPAARYATLMLVGAKLPRAGVVIQKKHDRMCGASPGSHRTQRRRSSVDAATPLKVIRSARAPERNRADDIVPLRVIHSPAKADGDEPVHRTERMVGDDQSEILERVTEGVIAPPYRAPELGVFEPRIGPGPAVLGSDGTLAVEFLSEHVFVRRARWRYGRVRPIGLASEQPYGPVRRGRIGLGIEIAARYRVERA